MIFASATEPPIAWDELQLSQTEMQNALRDWIVMRYGKNDPEWRDYLKRRLRELRWRLLKRRLLGWLPA